MTVSERVLKTIALRRIIRDIILFDIQASKDKYEFLSTLTTTSALVKIAILSWVYSEESDDKPLKIKTKMETYHINCISGYDDNIWEVLNNINKISSEVAFDDMIKINGKLINKKDISNSIDSWCTENSNTQDISENVYNKFIYPQIKGFFPIKTSFIKYM